MGTTPKCQDWGALLLAAAVAVTGCDSGRVGPDVGPADTGAPQAEPTELVAPARWPGFPLLPDGDFPIAGWCAPPVQETTTGRLLEYAGAGFTVLLPALEDRYAVESNRERLAAAREVGLWAIVRDDRVHPDETSREGWRTRVDEVVAAYGDSAALLAYFLADEPPPAQHGSLAQLTRYFATRDGEHPTYVNLLGLSPAGVGHHGLTYRAYLEGFLTAARPAFFSVDLYTMLWSRDLPNLCPGLDSARVASRRYETPFWAVLQLTPHFEYRDLSVAELSYQAMLALAYGAKGLVWFTYWTPRPDATGYRRGPIAFAGDRTPAYQRVAAVNRRVRQLGRLLGRSEVIAVHHGGTLPHDGTPLAGNLPLQTAEGGDLTIGFFAAATGTEPEVLPDTLALLVSRDYRHPIRAQLKWRGEMATWEEATGRWASYPRPAAPIELPPGGARLLRFRSRP